MDNRKERLMISITKEAHLRTKLVKKINKTLSYYRDGYLHLDKIKLWGEIAYTTGTQREKGYILLVSRHPLSRRSYICYGELSDIEYDPSTCIHIIVRYRAKSTVVVCIPYKTLEVRTHKILQCPDGEYEQLSRRVL